MNTLALDLEEVRDGDPRLSRFVRDARRRAGVSPDEPATWFAYIDDGNDRALVTLGRSPADVILTCCLHAAARAYDRRGAGRWLVENRAGEDPPVPSLFLLVEAKHDPDDPFDVDVPRHLLGS